MASFSSMSSSFPSLCVYVCPSLPPPSLPLSVCLSVRLSVCPSVRLSVCPSVRLSVCPSVRLSVCLSVSVCGARAMLKRVDGGADGRINLCRCFSFVAYYTVYIDVYLDLLSLIYLYMYVYICIYIYIFFLFNCLYVHTYTHSIQYKYKDTNSPKRAQRAHNQDTYCHTIRSSHEARVLLRLPCASPRLPSSRLWWRSGHSSSQVV